MKDGKYDAAIVATCALKRLGMEDEIAEVLPFPTHPLQGFLAITAKKGSQDLKQAFASKSIFDKQGTVSLVGFGPGDPELLTIKAAKAIDAADIIFYDDLIDDSYLADKKPRRSTWASVPAITTRSRQKSTVSSSKQHERARTWFA